MINDPSGSGKLEFDCSHISIQASYIQLGPGQDNYIDFCGIEALTRQLTADLPSSDLSLEFPAPDLASKLLYSGFSDLISSTHFTA